MEEYNRVTDILRPWMNFDNIPPAVLERACDRGTQVHKYISCFFLGLEKPIYDIQIEPYIISFQRFWKDNKKNYSLNNICNEKRFYCDKLKITGQLDLVIEMEDKTYIFDWKTSAQYNKTWDIQGAAYKYLLESNGFENIEDILFVKLNKEGKKPTLYKSHDYQKNLNIFQKCVELYRFFEYKKQDKYEIKS